MARTFLPATITIAVLLALAPAADCGQPDSTASDAEQKARSLAELREYFQAETTKLAAADLADVHTAADWKTHSTQARQQLHEMLGLDPLPQRTPLEATITGKVEHPEFTIEKVHYQSMPGLYVTGNLYLPKKRQPDEKLPAILYVCGHGRVLENGVSMGNKTHYQHHGGWFARNGYVCLMIDTIQLGEIEGMHHGTYRYNNWWWLNRGYTPAGVEAWNGIRGLDYLASRPEVDADKFGVTGRSGGGAYSWWIAALDERVKVAVPVAGITNLQNHIVDDCIEGHCDCMFMVNTYRWDFATLASLVAPRPLLISNTDKDRIFPLDGVVDVYNKTRRIYRLLDAEKKIGLHITEGPHADTQQLRVHAFQWFNKYLKNDDGLIETVATKHTPPADLKVFPAKQLPADELVTKIHESFVPAASAPQVPDDEKTWQDLQRQWRHSLKQDVFRGWPTKADKLNFKKIATQTADGLQLASYEFQSQLHVNLPLYVINPAGLKPEDVKQLHVKVLDETAWVNVLSVLRSIFADTLPASPPTKVAATGYKQLKDYLVKKRVAIAFVLPRGIGPTTWTTDKREQIHIQRRFALLGQTLDGMCVYDVQRAVAALRSEPGFAATPCWLQSRRQMAGVTLYASLFMNDVERIDLDDLPTTHRNGPYLLNVRRVFDLPQVVAWAGTRSQVNLNQPAETWTWANTLQKTLGHKGKLNFRGSANSQDVWWP